MRKASIFLLSRCARRTPATPLYTRCISGSSSSSPFYSSSHLNCSTQSNGLFLKSHPFEAYPSRNIGTLVEKHDELSSAQTESERSRVEEDFMSADTAEEKIRALSKMESWIDERKLGMASLQVGLKLEEEGEEPEKVLGFANRALKLLGVDDKSSLLVAITLKVMGSANFRMKRVSDSLECLNRADRLLGRLAEEGSDLANVWPVMHSVQQLLAQAKTSIGKREDALVNFQKCLEIKGRTLDKGSLEFGAGCRDLAEAYAAVVNFKEALPYSLKSLEINKNHLGDSSVEVGNDRRLLGIIYSGLEEHEKALQQIKMYQDVLRKHGWGSDLLRTEVDAANMRIALGRYDEAVDNLKAVAQQTDKDSETRALVFISMAKALCFQDKFSESKRCLEVASEILDKKETISPSEIIEAYTEMSMQYESVNEFETAISLLKKTLALLEKVPQEMNLKGSVSARIGWLFILTGKASQAIPYLESAAKILTEGFGPKHFGLGYIYNNLGTAYLELGRHQLAAETFAVAKDIMDASLGPNHEDSIETCRNISKAYEGIGSYARAIEFQQKVVDAWEKHEQNGQDELREAQRLLEQLKRKASHP